MSHDFIPMVSVSLDSIDLGPGPIRHTNLQPALLRQIEEVYRDAGHFIWGTREEFERGFMREMHPDREVAVWRQIADAYGLYCQRHVKHRTLGDEEGARLVRTLAGISTGMHLASGLQGLTKVDKAVAGRLVACWQSLYGSTIAPVTLEVRRSS